MADALSLLANIVMAWNTVQMQGFWEARTLPSALIVNSLEIIPHGKCAFDDIMDDIAFMGNANIIQGIPAHHSVLTDKADYVRFNLDMNTRLALM